MEAKKMLETDDSALMRSVIYDIINGDEKSPAAGRGISAWTAASGQREDVREGKAAEAAEPVQRALQRAPGGKVVAIASSTGGPKALQTVISQLPAQLDAPVLLVQHMPKGFTASLAERLDEVSQVLVKEAEEGEELRCGVVYVAMGGMHMNVRTEPGGKYTVHYSDEPYREGVKPSANYLYESLSDSRFEKIVCVVMTGMGADGTEGIRRLAEKKKPHVITQDQDSCVVYGMPKSVVNAGLCDQVVPLENLAREIVQQIGLRG